jgi:hypothetical protein
MTIKQIDEKLLSLFSKYNDPKKRSTPLSRFIVDVSFQLLIIAFVIYCSHEADGSLWLRDSQEYRFSWLGYIFVAPCLVCIFYLWRVYRRSEKSK